jgi:hypothetical protein
MRLRSTLDENQFYTLAGLPLPEALLNSSITKQPPPDRANRANRPDFLCRLK